MIVTHPFFSNKYLIPTISVLLLFALFVPPLIVYFEPREKVQVVDPKFTEISDLLQTKCSDCHTPNKTVYPFYFNLPIAHQIISNDIKHAQNALVITEDQLAGKEAINAVDIVRIGAQIKNDAMPPLRYKALHWRALVSESEKTKLLDWVKQYSDQTSLRAIPKITIADLKKDKISLGEKLFNDKRLSSDNTISCATCHSFAKGGTDGMVNSIGIHKQHGPINAPTVFNAANNFCQFWDGRAKDLQDQANGPVNNPIEMGSNWPQAITKLKTDKYYGSKFKALYSDGITSKNITDAIAAYEKTLLTPNSRFDKFISGDTSILNSEEKKGYALFMSNNCSTCHSGINFGGLSFERLGIYDDYFAKRGNLTIADNGRFNVTKIKTDMHRFKVPTLRNIETTAPYFHDGSTFDLKQAVKIMAHYQCNKDLSDTDTNAIVSFLKTLTGEYKGIEINQISAVNAK